MARKSKAEEWLTPDGLLRVKGWARDGLKDAEIWGNMGIGKTLFYEMQNQFPEFADALKQGKAPVDITVEDALLTSALGQIVTVREPIKLKTKKQLKDKGTSEEERIEYVERQIYIPPNVTAQIFWSKNRRPDKWRDKPVYEEDETGPIREILVAMKEVAETGQSKVIHDAEHVSTD